MAFYGLSVSNSFANSWGPALSSLSSSTYSAASSGGYGWIGSIGSAIGNIFSAFQTGYKVGNDITSIYNTYNNAKYQKEMSKIQSELLDMQAQQYNTAAEMVWRSGYQQVAEISYRTGVAKAATKVSQAASGVQLRTGNTAEVMATHNIAREIQINQVLSNTINKAFGLRMEGINIKGKALAEQASANNISPWAAAVTKGLNVLSDPTGATDNTLLPGSKSSGSGAIDNVMRLGSSIIDAFGNGGGMSGGGLGDE